MQRLSSGWRSFPGCRMAWVLKARIWEGGTWGRMFQEEGLGEKVQSWFGKTPLDLVSRSFLPLERKTVTREKNKQVSRGLILQDLECCTQQSGLHFAKIRSHKSLWGGMYLDTDFRKYAIICKEEWVVEEQENKGWGDTVWEWEAKAGIRD